MPGALPESFGDYQLVERLGLGGMAETFVALRKGPGGFEQRVCLKRILPVFANDGDFIDLFLREARMSALLHHGHIARVLDFGSVDDAHYMTLELIEGIDLRGLLHHLRRRAERLDPALVAYLAHALGAALDYAHTASADGVAAGIIHRDVSPSNVLLSRAGEVKLADFGVAKAINRPGSVQSHALKGKVPYMAPEYAVGRTCGPRSDLFSLGVLLYECLAGFRPYDGGNDMQTLEFARRGQREPLAELAPGAPDGFVRAIEALLSPEPDGRPLHARAFLEWIDDSPPPPLARRELARLVRSAGHTESVATRPGLASTRPAVTPRRPKRLHSGG
jgi:serine/threonine protein kinase